MSALKRLSSVSIALALCVPAAGFAADISISPLRLDLSNTANIVSMTMFNMDKADGPINAEVSAKAWTQQNGQDNYQDTQKIFAIPPIISVPAGGSQVIRVALATAPTTVEQAFRIYIDQIPDQDSTSQNRKTEGQVNIIYDIHVPVFIAPLGPKIEKLSFNAVKTGPDSLTLDISNVGNVHSHILDLKVFAGSQQIADLNKSSYLLAGSTDTIAISTTKNIDAQEVNIALTTDDNNTKQIIPLTISK